MVFAFSCASRFRLPDLRFSIRNEVGFQNEISYKNENFIWNENRNEPIPEWVIINLWEKFRQGIMWTDAKKYIMEMEWTRSGLKVISVSCE